MSKPWTLGALQLKDISIWMQRCRASSSALPLDLLHGPAEADAGAPLRSQDCRGTCRVGTALTPRASLRRPFAFDMSLGASCMATPAYARQ